MRNLICFILIILLLASPCLARDFIVDFVEENYKETKVPYSHEPEVYHSIQVTSSAGPKLLILKGSASNYRTWLRQYISQDKRFIVRVDDEQNSGFISAKAFEVDVQDIHPFNPGKWVSPIPETYTGKSLDGDDHILVLDTDPVRIQLISSVIRKMGYSVMVTGSGEAGLGTFKVQPDKFQMILALHGIPGMSIETFVSHILDIDQSIPIVVETGYQNKQTLEKFVSKFSDTASVVVKPVVLDDLQNTIKQLVKGSS